MENGPHESAWDMKKEDIMEQNELTASSIQSKQGMTTMSKIIKARAPLCSIYNVEHRNRAEEDKLDFG